MVTRSIESAQRKVEARNFDIRKQLLEYDDVANEQRKAIYQQRNELLEAADISPTIAAMRHSVFADLTNLFVPPESIEEQWDLPALEQVLHDEWQIDLPLGKKVAEAEQIDIEDIRATVIEAADTAYQHKVEWIGREGFSQFERMVMLQTLDNRWREHLAALDHLRQGIHLRGYAQQDPKQAYKREAFELFAELLEAIKQEVIRAIMTVQIQSPEQLEEVTGHFEEQMEHLSHIEYRHPGFDTENEDAGSVGDATEATAAVAPRTVTKVGRNEPCPCGSGKKYKQCHGSLG
jgi:preprotein translocase subunit SecA